MALVIRLKALVVRLGVLGFFVIGLTACGEEQGQSGREGFIMLDVWMHADEQSALQTLQSQVAAFNASQYRIRVNAVILPTASYESRIQDAADEGSLPDIIEVGPGQLARYAWLSYLRPIDKLLTDSTRERLLAAVNVEDSYEGRIYAVASHTQPVVLYARRDLLDAAGIALPKPGHSWDDRTFSRVLARLTQHDTDGRVLEIDLGQEGDGAADVLLPAIHSGGGEIIDLQNGPRVLGALDSSATIRVMTLLQGWARSRYLAFEAAGANDDFAQGRVALSWTTVEQGAAYRRRWGQRLLVLPPPDFGHGIRLHLTGWSWAVSRDCRNAQAAMRFLEYIVEDERMIEMAKASHALPVSPTALARWPDDTYSAEAELLRHATADTFVATPSTPAYPLLRRAFSKIVETTATDHDVATTLHDQALVLQRKIAGFVRR